MRKNKMLVFLVLLLCLNCCGCREKGGADMQLESAALELKEENAETPEEKETIFVYVCGAVCREGVYELAAGSRVYEAVEKAGGFTGEAASAGVNQAALLKDEEQLYIPTEEEMQNQTPASGGMQDDGKININTAAKTELMTLAGIGEAKAESILRYREEHGRFQSVEEIKQIPGIKDGVFEKIKELITV